MSGDLMQALALQFNLSETTFVLPSEQASARVRIFSTHRELPFAGHPTLGSAAVVRDLFHTGQSMTLETKVGNIPVSSEGDVFTLKANAPRWKLEPANADTLVAMLNLRAAEIAEPVLWMNTGFEQLLVPLRSVEALAKVRVDSTVAANFANEMGLVKIYLWAESGPAQINARFFFTRSPGVLGEDPGTGSACANLGGWWIATGVTLPRAVTVRQGDHIGRPCRLQLRVSQGGEIFMGGRVLEIGRGSITL